MYAVISAGGKQYRVAPGEKVRLESIAAEVGSDLELGGVLAVANDDGQLLTGESVASAKIAATVTKHGRGEKLIVFKFKRKKQYKRLYGHRQNYTEIMVNQVLA